MLFKLLAIIHVEPERFFMYREEVAKVEELSERISKLRGSL
jgi:hypothetical protein